MDTNTINSIINLESNELYEKAMAFKENKDYSNYAVYLTMAANKDYGIAIEECMEDYHNDTVHLKQNFTHTHPFYEATKDYGYSLNYLGYIYNGGHSVIKSKDKANEYYELAIKKGNHVAMYNLGIDTSDKKRQKELYALAVEKGNCRAMTNLGKIYFKGCAAANIDKDIDKAKTLYEGAMKYDRDTALKNLIELYSSTDLKNDTEYVFNYFNGIGKLEELGKIYKYDSKNTKEQNLKLKDLYERIVKVGIKGLNNLVTLYTNTDLKNDTEYVFNYFQNLDSIDSLGIIYAFDSHIMNLLKENIKLKQNIASHEKKKLLGKN
jgi:TPR repeat protein